MNRIINIFDIMLIDPITNLHTVSRNTIVQYHNQKNINYIYNAGLSLFSGNKKRNNRITKQIKVQKKENQLKNFSGPNFGFDSRPHLINDCNKNK